MKRVLFTAIGTTDPVRGLRDGGIMHIMRHYRPETVYIFLSAEMVNRDRMDHRIDKTFAFIRDHWDGYDPGLVRFDTDIEDPSDMDILVGPMTAAMEQVVRENPDAQVLINLSSGTPQMEIILAQLALHPSYPTLGVQVKSPEKQSGQAERTNTARYSVDEALANNNDELHQLEDRCRNPQMVAMRREAARNRLRSFLDQRNYAAIAQMADSLPQDMVTLACHLDYRSRFRLAEAEAAAAGLEIPDLEVGRGVLSQPVYEMVEYFMGLKHLVHLRRYTEFLLRLNPFLVRLQMTTLEELLQARGIREEEMIPVVDGRKKVSPVCIDRCAPGLRAYMESEFRCALKERDLSIRAINIMLAYFGLDPAAHKLLRNCEQLNSSLRNPAAHDLFSVTDEMIRDHCGMDARTIVRKLEEMLTAVLARYGDRGLEKRLGVYERCDGILRDCL